MSDPNQSSGGLATTQLTHVGLPAGHVVEISCNQRVFATVRERWGHLLEAGVR